MNKLNSSAVFYRYHGLRLWHRIFRLKWAAWWWFFCRSSDQVRPLLSDILQTSRKTASSLRLVVSRKVLDLTGHARDLVASERRPQRRRRLFRNVRNSLDKVRRSLLRPAPYQYVSRSIIPDAKSKKDNDHWKAQRWLIGLKPNFKRRSFSHWKLSVSKYHDKKLIN